MIICSLLVMTGLDPEHVEATDRRHLATAESYHKSGMGQPVPGGTLAWGTVNAPSIINPVLTVTSVSSSLLELLFDSLIRLDYQGKLVPGLAKSWTVSPDKLEYTFYLHENIFFHDGHPLTAEDVKFTFELVEDPAVRSPKKSKQDDIVSWTIIDPYTFKIRLSKPAETVLYKFTIEILPKHIFETEDIRLSRYNYAPIGSGPYKFNSWDHDTNQIELDANEQYFEGRPNIDKIIVKTYQDNTQLWTALMRNDVDLVLYLNPNDFEILRKDGAFKTYEIAWEMYLGIAYNLNDPILSDQRIRRAIAKSVDRRAILDQVGMPGRIANGPFHPLSIGFNRDVKPIEYDPVEAIRSLEELGWSSMDYDGIRMRGDEKFVLRLLVDASDRNYMRVAQVLRQQLSAVGIRLEVVLYEDESELTEDFLSMHRPQAWLRFFDGTGHDYSGNGPLMNWFVDEGSLNRLWAYSDDRVQEIYDQGRNTTDMIVRDRLYKQVHQIIYDGQPVLFMYFPTSYHAVSSRIHNTDYLFNINMPVNVIKDWHIPVNSN